MRGFQKGQSGNPAGRPKGIMDKRLFFAGIIDSKKEDLLEKAVELALSGNEHMLKLLLDRLLPSKTREDILPDHVGEIEGKLTEQGDTVSRMITDRKITPSVGKTLIEVVTAKAALKKTDDLEERVAKIEEIQKQKNV